ncbi:MULTISPECIES: ABC transporter ATP-binding protein [unclassified Curtobacterium]|uniref:ABC transporter ATP-binding protein n=1 Tax=unclassified Curtobacterium TaxID=257496 RepID=UPI000DA93C87|nr:MULTISPECIES: ABC transporter ATP-binding protein [unclassified Curtobacterium]PZF44638.1 ABC transporter ATP-binding protein [Curtobacterium sp. MCLR17_053]PZF52719.1 ABC transporter ATP-binding protein [Curtobacterium sp. MCLR17_051]
MTHTVEARDVRKGYPDATGRRTEIIRGVSLDVAPGEMVSIVGPSGSGKSTLLYGLSGLEPADAGTVTIDGVDIGALSPTRLARFRREKVGFVFQSYNLIPALTVRENVTLPLRLARGRVVESEVQAALAAVGIAELAHQRPGALSGGQQQRVAIARVLVTSPRVVFADEPTGALDTVTGSVVLDLLRESARGDRSVVMVTHDLDAAARADRVLVLQDGLIREELRDPDPRIVFDAVARASAWRTGQ